MSGITCLNRFAKQQGREFLFLVAFCNSISVVISGDSGDSGDSGVYFTSFRSLHSKKSLKNCFIEIELLFL